MREMISMVVVLTVLAAFSGGILSALKDSTADKIESQVLKFQKAPAIAEIFEEPENDPLAERFTVEGDDVKLQVFPAKLSDGVTAVAFEATGAGFGGPIGLMVGVNVETDEIIAARVTTHVETPGIGDRAKTDLSFVDQFNGKVLVEADLNATGNGGEIDAMSGATVTSVGVCQAAVQAQALYKKLKPEIVNQIN